MLRPDVRPLATAVEDGAIGAARDRVEEDAAAAASGCVRAERGSARAGEFGRLRRGRGREGHSDGDLMLFLASPHRTCSEGFLTASYGAGLGSNFRLGVLRSI